MRNSQTTILFIFRLLDKTTTARPCRPRNPFLWQSNIRKRLRQTGQEYINVNGIVQPERKMRGTCMATCMFQCYAKFDDVDRHELHQQFWRLADADKYSFYERYTMRKGTARSRKKDGESRRQFSYLYFFENSDGERLQVCQKFFVLTLDISKGRIYRYFAQIKPAAAVERTGDDDETDTDSNLKPKRRKKRAGRLNDGTIIVPM